uniref:Uncharacterized protein n=1 Tax=Anguilla anguilla TaxID=7936 RepID=A0A0E9XZ92_ANGAN
MRNILQHNFKNYIHPGPLVINE